MAPLPALSSFRTRPRTACPAACRHESRYSVLRKRNSNRTARTSCPFLLFWRRRQNLPTVSEERTRGRVVRVYTQPSDESSKTMSRAGKSTRNREQWVGDALPKPTVLIMNINLERGDESRRRRETRESIKLRIGNKTRAGGACQRAGRTIGSIRLGGDLSCVLYPRNSNAAFDAFACCGTMAPMHLG